MRLLGMPCPLPSRPVPTQSNFGVKVSCQEVQLPSATGKGMTQTASF